MGGTQGHDPKFVQPHFASKDDTGHEKVTWLYREVIWRLTCISDQRLLILNL